MKNKKIWWIILGIIAIYLIYRYVQYSNCKKAALTDPLANTYTCSFKVFGSAKVANTPVTK